MSPPSPKTPLLEGVTVVNLASVGPAARASRTLADYGARVIQVSPVSKKGAKQIVPAFHTYGAGRGIERMRLDLKSGSGRDALLRVIALSDVFIESFRPGVAARLGLGWDDVHSANPRLVYCSTTGYGQDGPASTWAGHDINYLAMSGFLACSEPRRDGAPPIPGATVADSAGGGMQAVLSILAALVRRGVSGEGSYLDVAATEGVVSLMSLAIDQYLATGEVAGPRRVLLTGRYACYDVYECSDRGFVSVGAIEPNFYRNLCERLGLEHYAGDQMDDAKQDEIRAAFAKVFKTRTRDEWTETLAPNDTCVAPVLTIPELTKNDHLRARGLFMNAEHPEEGAFEQVAPVLAGGVREQPPTQVRPHDETDTQRILADAGLASREVEALIESGAAE